ncbi:MAG: YihA family ribosome biogenesis GTP-binding protein [Solobacterium sp.]|nr:YihA family ribosome biogenesis GTP-binding protein [Solobacterium sp.]
MQYHEVRFTGSAVNQNQWPETSYPEIVFAGRSNAGKSSLINALVNRNNIAYSGKTPGKTRMLNFFEVDEKYSFADAPGYGYAAGNKDTADTFSRLMDPYFAHREALKLVVLVLDIRRIPNEDDLLMLDYARQAGIPLLAVCTKSDKLSNNQIFNQKQKILKTLKLSPEHLVVCSPLKKENLDQVWEKIGLLINGQS